MLIAPTEKTGAASLDMKALAEVTDPDALVKLLEPMLKAYETWITETKRASLASDIQSDPQLRDAAEENIRKCEVCYRRISASLQLLPK